MKNSKTYNECEISLSTFKPCLDRSKNGNMRPNQKLFLGALQWQHIICISLDNVLLYAFFFVRRRRRRRRSFATMANRLSW